MKMTPSSVNNNTNINKKIALPRIKVGVPCQTVNTELYIFYALEWRIRDPISTIF